MVRLKAFFYFVDNFEANVILNSVWMVGFQGLWLGRTVTTSGMHYLVMTSNFFWPELDYLDTNDMWFQQDKAVYHATHVTLDILHKLLESMSFADVKMPSRT